MSPHPRAPDRSRAKESTHERPDDHGRPGPTVSRTWLRVYRVEQLPPGRGQAALINGQQVALFRLHCGELHAVSRKDPVSGSNVMARRIVGSTGDDVPTITSPLYKEVYDLRDGSSVSDPQYSLGVWPVRVEDGDVLIAVDAA